MGDRLLSAGGRRFTKTGFSDELAKMAAAMRARIDANVSGFDPDPAAVARRRKQALDPVAGFKFFAETYFPHYLTAAPSLLHNYLFRRLAEIAASTAMTGVREVDIAPRGAAKSTLVSLIYPIWRPLIGKSHYIIIIMDAYAQAALALEAIKAELESNQRLAMDFPEIFGKGRVWREGEIVIKNGCRIEGVGAGMKLRGRRHGAHRPDLVILDDVENDENVRSPEQRNKLESWILKAVLKLGAADDSMDLLHIGTVLHYDAVILRNAARPGWRSARFRALMDMPEAMDLWDEWEETLRNEGAAAAHAFYQVRKAEMDKGAVLNWPAMQSLERLMLQRAESPAAFASEQQGEPVSENSAFKLEDLTYWAQIKRDLLLFGAVDPSLGKRGKQRDPSAILVGGIDKSGEYPTMDIVEASIRKRTPDKIIEDILAMQSRYHCQIWFVESVQFQEFLRTELMKRALQRGIVLPAMPIIPNTDKALRIESLQPHVVMGAIRFHSSQRTLIEQLTQWPDGDHDDGPDCLEMLWVNAIRFAAQAMTGTGGIKSAPRRRPGFAAGYNL
ncbi:hypothetical protein DPQ22_09615 [Candidatus Tokpelaia sp.]|nr:hypothetical protein DPQ22_09615 [Candidatus Tokpelaia sp.]